MNIWFIFTYKVLGFSMKTHTHNTRVFYIALYSSLLTNLLLLCCCYPVVVVVVVRSAGCEARGAALLALLGGRGEGPAHGLGGELRVVAGVRGEHLEGRAAVALVVDEHRAVDDLGDRAVGGLLDLLGDGVKGLGGELLDARVVVELGLARGRGGHGDALVHQLSDGDPGVVLEEVDGGREGFQVPVGREPAVDLGVDADYGGLVGLVVARERAVAVLGAVARRAPGLLRLEVLGVRLVAQVLGDVVGHVHGAALAVREVGVLGLALLRLEGRVEAGHEGEIKDVQGVPVAGRPELELEGRGVVGVEVGHPKRVDARGELEPRHGGDPQVEHGDLGVALGARLGVLDHHVGRDVHHRLVIGQVPNHEDRGGILGAKLFCGVRGGERGHMVPVAAVERGPAADGAVARIHLMEGGRHASRPVCLRDGGHAAGHQGGEQH